MSEQMHSHTCEWVDALEDARVVHGPVGHMPGSCEEWLVFFGLQRPPVHEGGEFRIDPLLGDFLSVLDGVCKDHGVSVVCVTFAQLFIESVGGVKLSTFGLNACADLSDGRSVDAVLWCSVLNPDHTESVCCLGSSPG